MSDFSSPKKPEAVWEPGTLDKTRRNIGPIDENEAKKMMKKLGGEIKTEKAAVVDYSNLPRSKELARKAVTGSTVKATGKTAGDVASFSGGSKYGYAVPEKSTQNSLFLPEINAKEKQAMDKLMMSEDFKIKPNFGIFNFLRKFRKNGTEVVRKSFVQYTLQKHVDHIQEFVNVVKGINQISPDTYKTKIMNSSEDKFRFLRIVGSFSTRKLQNFVDDLQTNADETTVQMLIPFVKTFYKDFLKIYYLGEQRISGFFKEIYADLMKYPKFDQKKIMVLSKNGISEWFYVYSSVIKGMYPLLMRMCSPKFYYFQDFFLTQTAKIFEFLEITKYDVLLPNKKSEVKSKDSESVPEKTEEEIKAEKEAEEKKNSESRKKMEVVNAGLRLLDSLFPEAGFDKIETMPDMFPYFQPIYQFRDGYNLLNPKNPLQITITLIRIVEDLFQGCRNVVFTEENTDETSGNSGEKISVALSEWSVYREVLFEKYYCEQIKDFVNNEYSHQGDFKNSLFGKKILTTLLWQTKYQFLPHFEFEQLLLEKPKNESQYRPICFRAEFLFRYFGSLVANIEANAKTKGEVFGIKNPWERYKFDLPNAVSRRMDILLGAKRSETAATNANLLKYAYYVIAVLNWWINDAASPAYSTDSSKIYRVNDKDGGPAFSVPEREDQNKLFADRVKQTIEKQKQSKANGQGN